jgi:hypothetical protein
MPTSRRVTSVSEKLICKSRARSGSVIWKRTRQTKRVKTHAQKPAQPKAVANRQIGKEGAVRVF